MLEAIVAVYADSGIGNGITQPVVLSADRVHFRSVTGDAAVIVGRKTLEDFPGGRPLKGRHNIVVSRQDLTVPGAEVVHSTEEALSAAKNHPRCLVLGGASIFEQFFPYLQKIFITKIGCRPESSRFSLTLMSFLTGSVQRKARFLRKTEFPTASVFMSAEPEKETNHVERQQIVGSQLLCPGGRCIWCFLPMDAAPACLQQ